MPKKFSLAWIRNQLYSNYHLVSEDSEGEPDYLSLQISYVEIVQEIANDKEPSSDVKLEWLMTLNTEYEDIVFTLGMSAPKDLI